MFCFFLFYLLQFFVSFPTSSAILLSSSRSCSFVLSLFESFVLPEDVALEGTEEGAATEGVFENFAAIAVTPEDKEELDVEGEGRGLLRVGEVARAAREGGGEFDGEGLLGGREVESSLTGDF